jgi:hypothetical protein
MCNCEICLAWQARVDELTKALIIRGEGDANHSPGPYNGMTKEEIQGEIDIATYNVNNPDHVPVTDIPEGQV